MTDDPHYRRLENLYAVAPVSRWYGAAAEISDGRARIRIPIRSDFYHPAGAVHGSVYFRALDDAAFFAANSRVRDTMVLTVSFNVHFTAPISEGELNALGWVVHESGRLFLAESELRDTTGQLLAKGSGTFTRSRIPLSPEIGYTDPPEKS